MRELRRPVVGPGIVDMAEMAIFRINMDCIGSEACRHCSIEAEEEVAVDSRVDCSSHCTSPAAEVGIVDCMGAAYCHGAYPALPADDDRSSYRRGRNFQTSSDVRGGLEAVKFQSRAARRRG